MYTDFGGCGLSTFGDIATFKKWLNFPFGSMVIKEFNRSESAQKIQSSSNGCNMHVHQFWWVWSLHFRRYRYFQKTAKFPFRGMDYSPWSSKNLIDRNRLKKFNRSESAQKIQSSTDGCNMHVFILLIDVL